MEYVIHLKAEQMDPHFIHDFLYIRGESLQSCLQYMFLPGVEEMK